jgi:hypothetical protein
MGQTVAPKHNPVRRNARTGPLRLPAEGRSGPPPRWPIGSRFPSPELRLLWHHLWATPQAVAWERLGWTRVVARYAMVLIRAEAMNATALLEARQLEDRLGLTPKAMRMLLWEVATDEVAERRDETASDDDMRARLRAAPEA